MKLLAPAKLNLFLKILRRSEDGYHELSMLMEKIDLCDEIVLEKISEGIEFMDSTSRIPFEQNLAYRAARALHKASDAFRGDLGGAKIGLRKTIPIGAGLGGGSSDAASVLKGLNQLWDLNWPTEKLAEIGVKLGADVPFFLYEGPALVRGIGERVLPQRKLPKLWIILIYPGMAVDTAWAYRTWDLLGSQAPGVKELTQGNRDVSLPRDFGGLLEILHNDFEAVVFPKFPEIQAAKSALHKAGAAGALMSGSGSSVFGLFETKEERERALTKLAVRPNWKIFAAEIHDS